MVPNRYIVWPLALALNKAPRSVADAGDRNTEKTAKKTTIIRRRIYFPQKVLPEAARAK
jgi:hypothetical protein